MKLSVVIPVYNVAQYLRTCLDSALGQTLRDLEVVCVDDGSTDGSAAVLAEYAARDARIRVLTQTNAGQGAARNRGAAEARGEWIYFLDADDILQDRTALEKLVAQATQDRLDMLFFDSDIRCESPADAGRIPLGSYRRKRDYPGVRPGRDLLVAFHRRHEYCVSPCLVLLRRAFLLQRNIRFPEGVIYEDNVFMAEALLAAERCAHVRQAFYLRTVRPNSTMTGAATFRNVYGALRCWMAMEALARRDGLPGRVVSVFRTQAREFRWNALDYSRRSGLSDAVIEERLTPDERRHFRRAGRWTFADRIRNGIRCLRENGFWYTLKRCMRR